MSSALPEISFCETDAAKVEQAVITQYEAVSGTKLYPGDPVRLFLEAVAYLIVQQRILIDYAAKQNLLAYSGGDYLDHLGALTDTPRLTASAALATMRFSLSEALAFVVAIPAGTRVTPDGTLYFATSEAAEIPIGELSVDVSVACLETGAKGNGFVGGQVNRLVDPVAWVATVVNVTKSTGGADVEGDDAYRERIRTAWEKFSSAGPSGAYLHWASSAHQDIVDVSVRSPNPGDVEVRPLLAGGVIPGQDILDLVAAAVDDKKRRPLTDVVTVLAPEAVSYDVALTYYVSNADAALAARIQQAVSDAVAAYVSWQRSALGRDLNPSELVRRVQDAGAKRVAVASPAHQALESWQAAQEGTVAVTYGGLEDA